MGHRIRSVAGAVDGWVQRGVVVHLELAVEFEAAGAGEDLGPELVEAADEIVALVGEKRQALPVALAMAFGDFGAGDFFARVVELEGEDGEAIDDESGAFGMEFGRGVGQAGGGKGFEKLGVATLGEVVAALVQPVDGALDLGDIVVGGAGGAGAVLGMPEIEVGAVLREDQIEEETVRGGEGKERVGGSPGVAMPQGDGGIVEGGDFDGGERKGVGH